MLIRVIASTHKRNCPSLAVSVDVSSAFLCLSYTFSTTLNNNILVHYLIGTGFIMHCILNILCLTQMYFFYFIAFLTCFCSARYNGFWWRPETSSTAQARSYSLLYEQIDEKAVEIVRILGFPSSNPESK